MLILKASRGRYRIALPTYVLFYGMVLKFYNYFLLKKSKGEKKPFMGEALLKFWISYTAFIINYIIIDSQI